MLTDIRHTNEKQYSTELLSVNTMYEMEVYSPMIVDRDLNRIQPFNCNNSDKLILFL